MEEKTVDFHEMMKEKLHGSIDHKYKTMIFGFAAVKCDCIKPVEALFPEVIKCPIELGKGLSIFYPHTEIAKAFLHEDRIHLTKKALAGAGCSEKNIEKVLKEAGAEEEEIYFIINETLLEEEAVI